MTFVLSLIPAVACVALMSGAGAALRLATRTPLARVPWIARRAHSQAPDPAEDSRA